MRKSASRPSRNQDPEPPVINHELPSYEDAVDTNRQFRSNPPAIERQSRRYNPPAVVRQSRRSNPPADERQSRRSLLIKLSSNDDAKRQSGGESLRSNNPNNPKPHATFEKQSRVSNARPTSNPSQLDVNKKKRKKSNKHKKRELSYLATVCARVAQKWVLPSYTPSTLKEMMTRSDFKQPNGYFDIGNGLWLNKDGNVVDLGKYPLKSGHYLSEKSFAGEIRERRLNMISLLQKGLREDLELLLDLFEILLESKYVALVLVYRIVLRLLNSLDLKYSLRYKTLETSIEKIKTLASNHLNTLSNEQKERSENANTWKEKIIDFGKTYLLDVDTKKHQKMVHDMDTDPRIQSILNLDDGLFIDIEMMEEKREHFEMGDVTMNRTELLEQLSGDTRFFLSTDDESSNATLDLFPLVNILTKYQNTLLSNVFAYVWGESLTQDASRSLRHRISVQIPHQIKHHNPGYYDAMFVKDVLSGSIGLELIDEGESREAFLLVLRLTTRLLMLDPLSTIEGKEGTQLLLERLYIEFMQEKLHPTRKATGFDTGVCEVLVSRFLSTDSWNVENSQVCSDARLKVLYETDVVDPVTVDSPHSGSPNEPFGEVFRFHLYKWNSKKLRSLRSNVWRHHSEKGPLPDFHDKSYFVSLCAQEVMAMSNPIYRMAVKRLPSSKYLFVDLSFLPRTVVDTLYRVNQDLCNRNPRDCAYLKLSPVLELK